MHVSDIAAGGGGNSTDSLHDTFMRAFVHIIIPVGCGALCTFNVTVDHNGHGSMFNQMQSSILIHQS